MAGRVAGEVPDTRLLNFVDTPAQVQYSSFGEASVLLDPATGGVVDLTRFRRVSVLIGATTAASCEIFMGKISGATLAQSFGVPLDARIHTFEVVGPQLTLVLRGGAAGTTESVQLWVYLSS